MYEWFRQHPSPTRGDEYPSVIIPPGGGPAQVTTAAQHQLRDDESDDSSLMRGTDNTPWRSLLPAEETRPPRPLSEGL